MTRVTYIAPVNIALIKYWGKRDEKLILPLNDSISISLDTENLCAKTTVMISPSFEKDRIWLNGREESFDNKRLQACLLEIRRLASEKGQPINSENRRLWKVHICSENNFPTAAGLASSAAGYACLVAALAKIYNVNADLSGIARLGSGSACRSLIGGFVRWHKGEKDDGSDSLATEIESSSHWPSLRVLILVVQDTQKKVSSSSGMQRSVETSELLKHRVSCVVPRRVEEIIKAIRNHDFDKLAEVTMKDSNQFHSITLDTFPPCAYMNDISHKIVGFVHAYNKLKGCTKVAYTFDAGPNAVLLLDKEDVGEVVALINQFFPPIDENNYVRGLEVPNVTLEKDLNLPYGPQEAGLLKYIIHTKIGEGPTEIKGNNVHLLDAKGLPYNKTG